MSVCPLTYAHHHPPTHPAHNFKTHRCLQNFLTPYKSLNQAVPLLMSSTIQENMMHNILQVGINTQQQVFFVISNQHS